MHAKSCVGAHIVRPFLTEDAGYRAGAHCAPLQGCIVLPVQINYIIPASKRQQASQKILRDFLTGLLRRTVSGPEINRFGKSSIVSFTAHLQAVQELIVWDVLLFIPGELQQRGYHIQPLAVVLERGIYAAIGKVGADKVLFPV